MQNASSASRTCSEPRSASEYTATVLSPSSRHARMTRTAISPRFAIRTLENIAKSDSRSWPCQGLPAPASYSAPRRRSGRGIDEEQRLSVLHRRAVVHQHPGDATIHIAGDLIEHLHLLEDADRLPGVDVVPFVDERRSVGLGSAVERADHGRDDRDQV